MNASHFFRADTQGLSAQNNDDDDDDATSFATAMSSALAEAKAFKNAPAAPSAGAKKGIQDADVVTESPTLVRTQSDIPESRPWRPCPPRPHLKANSRQASS